jgi:hypothetical protein
LCSAVHARFALLGLEPPDALGRFELVQTGQDLRAQSDLLAGEPLGQGVTSLAPAQP